MLARPGLRRGAASAVVTAAEIAAMPDLTGPYDQPRILFKASTDPAKQNRPSILLGTPPEGVVPICGPAEGLGAGQPLYKITSPTCDYVSLRLALLRAGFRRIGSGPKNDKMPANVVWGKSMPLRTPPGGSPKERAFLSTRLLHPHQKFNHFPSSHANLGCKAGMTVNLSKHVDLTSDFNPKTHLYPTERAIIRDWILQSPKHERFIWKPARGSCGRGILICRGGAGDDTELRAIEERIARKIRECEASGANPAMYKHYVVQRYINDPLLIDKKKFDLRLYVAVTSYSPTVVAYRHTLGFARFAASEYVHDDDISTSGAEGIGGGVGEKFAHLTNFSVGRQVFMSGLPEAGDILEPSHADMSSVVTPEAAAEAMKAASEKASELKWTTERLNKVFDDEPHRVSGLAAGQTVNREAMWAAVDDVIRKTLTCVQPRIARKMAEQDAEASKVHNRPVSFQRSYFELYGFDIMFDSRCRPWLIEVNTLPSLESSSVRDYHVKSAVVTDLLNLAMITPFDRTPEERKLFASATTGMASEEAALGDRDSSLVSDNCTQQTRHETSSSEKDVSETNAGDTGARSSSHSSSRADNDIFAYGESERPPCQKGKQGLGQREGQCYGQGLTDLPSGSVDALHSNANSNCGVSARETLPEASEAAKRILIGSSLEERLAFPVEDDKSRAYRLRDEEIFKGGFVRIL